MRLRYRATWQVAASGGKSQMARSGLHVQEMNRLLNVFEQMQGMVKKMTGMFKF